MITLMFYPQTSLQPNRHLQLSQDNNKAYVNLSQSNYYYHQVIYLITTAFASSVAGSFVVRSFTSSTPMNNPIPLKKKKKTKL